jgi:hypothetical protein
MTLANLATFGVAVGILHWILKLKLKIDTNYIDIYIEL